MNLFLNQFIEINCLNEPIYLKKHSYEHIWVMTQINWQKLF